MERYTQIFKILSDETRLRVLMLLFKKELCVCQLSGVLNISQPTISKALSKMRDLDWVQDNRQDKFVYYSLKPSDFLMTILSEIEKQIKNEDIFFEDLKNLESAESFLIKCQTVQHIGGQL